MIVDEMILKWNGTKKKWIELKWISSGASHAQYNTKRVDLTVDLELHN